MLFYNRHNPGAVIVKINLNTFLFKIRLKGFQIIFLWNYFCFNFCFNYFLINCFKLFTKIFVFIYIFSINIFWFIFICCCFLFVCVCVVFSNLFLFIEISILRDLFFVLFSVLYKPKTRPTSTTYLDWLNPSNGEDTRNTLLSVSSEASKLTQPKTLTSPKAAPKT